MRPTVLLTLALAAVSSVSVEAQASRDWITETTVTTSRRYQEFGWDAVAVADLGLRWSYPSGMGWGFSATGGYDFSNEASLVGGRARVFREWGVRRLEASAALLVTSVGTGGVGGVLGLAFYPRPWGAVVVQLDLVPTFPPQTPEYMTYVFDQFGNLETFGPEVERVPEVSFGLRVAERAGVVSWIGAGVLGVLGAVSAALPQFSL